ncbi:hypothetical protein [Actinoplanes palleronii]|uniref:Uncharacterized protein n=1 Tax=Actinoplanes palleronii TaxID=113570 RepID=A0ABQ4BSW3_9ACTN|nr:hypothetical protein [Actinoplanes palleronii]GIE73767.1 hypothetical protein Apa02nite_098750 [Actinoplanes palleronii]
MGLDATSPDFAEKLGALSHELGEVQFFGTQRVVEYHAWARAVNGEVTRAYCYLGESDEVMLAIGSPTPAEKAAHVGVVPPDDTEEWDTWSENAPTEETVLRIAGAWSVDRAALDDDAIQEAGWHGFSGRPPRGGRWRRLLHRLTS